MEYDDDEDEEDEDEEEEMEAEEEDDRRRPPADGLETPSGMATPSGLNSVTSTVPGGLETPEFVELRKKKRQESEAPGPGPSQPRDLYQVIPERESTSRGFMGSSTAYDISGLGQGGPGVLGADDLSKKVSRHSPSTWPRSSQDTRLYLNNTDDRSAKLAKSTFQSTLMKTSRKNSSKLDMMLLAQLPVVCTYLGPIRTGVDLMMSSVIR
jgi:hypothetical protein